VKQIVVRERMDFGSPPPLRYKDDPEDGVRPESNAWSLIHRVWDDGTEEFYAIGGPPLSPTSAYATWLSSVDTGHVPQLVGENSEWGDGLPQPERDAYFARK
jgi:hypothetical protein